MEYRVALEQVHPPLVSEARRGDGHSSGQRQVGLLRGPYRGDAAERVADDHSGLVSRGHPLYELADEAVKPREHRAGREAVPVPREPVGLAEAGQIDREGVAAPPREAAEQRAPGVGAVRVAVQQQERRSLARNLQDPGMYVRDSGPALPQTRAPPSSDAISSTDQSPSVEIPSPTCQPVHSAIAPPCTENSFPVIVHSSLAR
jgi:hypothetical protein